MKCNHTISTILELAEMAAEHVNRSFQIANSSFNIVQSRSLMLAEYFHPVYQSCGFIQLQALIKNVEHFQSLVIASSAVVNNRFQIAIEIFSRQFVDAALNCRDLIHVHSDAIAHCQQALSEIPEEKENK